jgi:hypothetical protein
MNEAVYSMDRVKTGNLVRARLSAVPRITKVPVQTLDLFILHDFLGESECGALVALIETNRTRQVKLPL